MKEYSVMDFQSGNGVRIFTGSLSLCSVLIQYKKEKISREVENWKKNRASRVVPHYCSLGIVPSFLR